MLNKAIAGVEASIAQVQAALDIAIKRDDILHLTSRLADLQAELQTLRFELGNLQAAAGGIAEISPDSAARIQALGAELDERIVADATISATLDFATAVLGKAKELRDSLG